MIPIGDEPNDPTSTPFVTWALIALNVLVFGLAKASASGEGAYEALVERYGSIPVSPTLSGMFTSMFMHADLMHIGGNMLFLWIYGDNVEARLGHLGYLAAYLATGLAGGLVDMAMRPNSGIPGIGASGAISGVLGMYLIGFPKNRVKLFVWFYWYVGVVRVPAWIVLLSFLLLQNLLPAFLGGGSGAGGGIAYGAHLGGFVSGALLFVVLLPVFRRMAPPREEWPSRRW